MNDRGIKYIDEYRNRTLINDLLEAINKAVKSEYTFMEVCGGHTAAIHRFGIPSLLPPGLKLISGPGCPVCVTGTGFIDRAIAYSAKEDFIVATFGDLIRVPGSISSLEKEKAAGNDVRVVLSSLDALEIAQANPGKKVLFLGIGFETTAPGIAATIKVAKTKGIMNFLLLSSIKVMPPAMDAIIKDGVSLDGFICPGHVAAITGSSVFRFIPEKYRLGCVISGFEPVDLLQTVYMLMQQVNDHIPAIQVQYRRAVTEKGNPVALRLISEIFEACDACWRGLGIIPLSGLRLQNKFAEFDAENVIPLNVAEIPENNSCLCGEILRGRKIPTDCPLFASRCTPENPVGACMVSGEGACNTYFRFAQ